MFTSSFKALLATLCLAATVAVDIKGTVQPVALEGTAEWNDPQSYQAKAIAWLEGDALSQSLSSERIIQRYAAACIYFATFNVENKYTDAEPGGWIKSTGWVQGSSECSWYGLTCNGNNEIEEIALAANRITGSFPAETKLLAPSLQRLDLFFNPVYNTGDEGHEWLGELSGLESLYYGQTHFEYGGIPPHISNLTSLIEYDCSDTLYSGPLVGSTFAPLTNLTYLVLSKNSYNSTVPLEIGQLPNLTFFYAQNANLKGDLSFMESMPSIYELWVDQNPELGGTIPAFVGNLQTLQSLSLTRCGFTGSVPSELGQLTDMVKLWLYDNDLTGSVPTELGNMAALDTLAVGDNALVGTMPEEICLHRQTWGPLQYLEADCSETAPEVECECCSCCKDCNPGTPSPDVVVVVPDASESEAELPMGTPSHDGQPVEISPVQVSKTGSICGSFDMDMKRVGNEFHLGIVGTDPAVLESLTGASSLMPFFFNLTDQVAGTAVSAGELVETSLTVSPTVDFTLSLNYNFLMTLTATVDGTECMANSVLTSGSFSSSRSSSP